MRNLPRYAAISDGILRRPLTCACRGRSEEKLAIDAASRLQTCPVSSFVVQRASARVGWLRGVMDSLTEAPSGAAVLLAVDDVQLLDDLSIFVLHQIVQRGVAKVILTVRRGQSIPTAVQENGPPDNSTVSS